MEISNLSDTEFKTLFIRMLKELSENLNSIKKIQSETKDSLIELKNNLQGNNSKVDEAKNEINDLEHKEAKNNQSEQEEKRIQALAGMAQWIECWPMNQRVTGLIPSQSTFPDLGCRPGSQ